MKKKTEKKNASWSSLLKIYKTAKIPWLWMLLVVLFSVGTQWLAVISVPYASRVDTGTMEAGGWLVSFVLITVIYNILDGGYDAVNGMGGASMARSVRRNTWRKLLHLPVKTYEQEDPQSFVSRMTKDTTYAYSALTALIQIVSISYGCYVAIREVIEIYAGFAWLVVVTIPVLIVCAIIVGKLQYKMNTILIGAYAKVTNYYGEHLPNVKYIKMNNMEQKEYEKAVQINQGKYKADVRYYLLYALSTPIISVAHYISIIVVMWVGSAFVRAGDMEVADLISLKGYFEIVMQNVALFIGVWQAVKASHGGCEKLAELVDLPEEDMTPGGETVEAGQDIVFRNVSFRYDEVGKTILENASFTIPGGKVTAIVGENGCGKSTIMRLLERFDAPCEGSITVGGRELEKLDLYRWRESLGYVFQGNQMVKGTVWENLAYGAPQDYSDAMLYTAAQDARALDFIQAREDGFQTMVDPFAPDFSGGQQQRMAIARVLLKQPDYLIMDEATSGIDNATEKAIWGSVRSRMAGKTTIVISHDMDVIRSADHIVVIKDGSVEAEGTVEDVKKNSATYLAIQNAMLMEAV